MTEQLDAIRIGIVSAVQTELDKFSSQVAEQLSSLSEQLAAERDARIQLDRRLAELSPSIEEQRADIELVEQRLRRAIDDELGEVQALSRRQDDVDARIDRVVDDANAGMSSAVEAIARPMVKELEHRHEELRGELDALGSNLAKFDEQAGRMVVHVNEVIRATEARLNEVSSSVTADLDSRASALATRLDEVSAQAARQQSEVSNVVGARVEAAEDRINDRLRTTEARVNEEVGQRIADIDAYVGRVSAGLDDSVTTLNDRINATEARFETVDEQIAAVRHSIEQVDADAIDELKERITGAAGEVELVRIDMDRFKGSVEESIDHATVRLTELETQMQEHYLDVATAVQLERLEEVERAIIALDPARFVTRDELASNGSNPAAELRDRPTTTTNGHSATAGIGGPPPPPPVGEQPLSSPAPSPLGAPPASAQ